MAGLYIHIPFCKQSCYYCDFHFSTNRSYQQEMVEAMVKEIIIQKPYLKGEPLDTIYFGGGTPSILQIAELEGLLDIIYKQFSVNPQPEITLEANPDDLSEDKLKNFHSLGINRLSIGIQSFDDQILKFLNRAHNSQEARNCVQNARRIGFDNISIDLIFSIPEASDATLKNDIKTGLSLKPDHISAYSLTIEEKTVFGNWQAKGKFQALADTTSADQFEYLIKTLDKNGYEQYEISNFCKDGKYARHNTSYWQNVNYLGIGPGAHSYNGSSRQYNIAHNPKYIKSLAQGIVPFEKETLEDKSRANEFLLTSLRTKWGCDLSLLKSLYRYDLMKDREKALNKFLKNGFLKLDEGILYLSRKGIFLADDIIGQLFQE